MMKDSREGARRGPVRWAVVGAGHIAQVAVLPGFNNATDSELVGLVSGDSTKRRALGERYGIEHCVDHGRYDQLLASGEVDAVYLAVPNHLHCEYAVVAAQHGVHVLCEKPMAVTEHECEQMMQAADDNDVSLMIAYRLHFDPAHLEVIAMTEDGEIGRPRYFTSSFSQNVHPGNVRLMSVEQGGGPVYDMGVYCIDAARYLFREEPLEVTAQAGSSDDPRFSACPETVTATLRFPGGCVASFIVGFGSADLSTYTLVGDAGFLTMDPAYEYAKSLSYRVCTKDGEDVRMFSRHDQFGAEISYFSRCIVDGRRPEPDALDGQADVHIIRGIHRSIEEGRTIKLLPVRQRHRPDPSQVVVRPAVEAPEEIRASSPRAS
jgi:predicted dehydrogenase